MVIPNTCRHASPTQPTDFPIHTHPPLGEGLIGRLHPRESGNIYLYDTNQSVALYYARHTGEMTTRRGTWTFNRH